MTLCDGNLQQYHELMRSPVDDYIVKVESFVSKIEAQKAAQSE